MNSRTSRLLRSYARCTGEPITTVKKEWNTTPRNKRGDVRVEMERGIWSGQLKDWRKLHKLVQKEAADFLSVPFDTYRGWESMEGTPPLYARKAMLVVMRMYQPKK